jgi:hypothetical protein
MKHLKSYKIFEEKDDDNEIPEGFEYSWNDINKSLVYLTDLGFEIDKPERYQWDYEEEAKRRYLADENGNKIKHTSAAWGQDYKSNVELAKWAIYELRLKKPVTINGISRETTKSGYFDEKQKFFLTENPEKMIEIYQEIDAFCAHFDKSYYSLLAKPDGYYLWLVVASVVSEDYINTRLDKEFNDKVKEKLNSDFYEPFGRFYNQVRSDYTKKFREEVFGGTLGRLEKGYYIKRFDFDKVTKQVLNTNKSQFDTDIERFLNYFNKPGYWNLGKYGFKAEYKVLTEEDCKILDEDDSKSKERFIGKNVLIVTFNYQDVLKKYKKDKFSKKED